MKTSFQSFLLIAGFCLTTHSYALPIDWNGSLGIDTHVITNARKTGDDCSAAIPTNGSQCIANGNKHARFQSYTLKLNPSIIVNDSATIKGEISTGSFRGGFLGGDSQWGGESASSYYHTSSAGTNSLVFNQLYAELYADTALFRVGKFAKHFGLGAVLNSGTSTSDRYFSLYDGFEAEFKLGNFTATPSWAKISTNTNTPNGQFDVIEKGLTALYDNSANNLKFGVYYGQRESESNSTYYSNAQAQDVNIIDVFIEKKWGNFKIALEAPMLSGEVGNTYGTGDNSNFDTNAYILESSYLVNPRWKLGFNAGLVKGDDASSNSFEGMYLHPNYKIAGLLFAYDYQGFNSADRNIFQASVTNVQYFKLFANYMSDTWTWKAAFTIATAQQVAESGNPFYDHENRLLISSANEDQSNDLGHEFDLGFDYFWNPSITINGYVNYHMVGDYFAFDNDSSTKINLSDVMSYGLGLSMQF